jgi:hypothetical protein
MEPKFKKKTATGSPAYRELKESPMPPRIQSLHAENKAQKDRKAFPGSQRNLVPSFLPNCQNI